VSGTTDQFGVVNHHLFLTSTGSVYGIGQNIKGELCLGDTLPRGSLVSLNMMNISQVSAGGYRYSMSPFSLFLSSNGTVYGCGVNNWGQLGNPQFSYIPTPILIPNLTNIISISAGTLHSVFLDSNGVVYSTGYGGNGVMGLGQSNLANQYGVVMMPGVPYITQIVAGAGCTYMLAQNGTVFGIGGNYGQMMGIGANYFTPQLISNLFNITNMYGGGGGVSDGPTFLFINSTGGVFGAGPNRKGELGLGYSYSPGGVFPLTGFGTAVKCSISESSICLDPTGRARVAGGNAYGQLGQADFDARVTTAVLQASYQYAILDFWVTPTGLFITHPNGTLYFGVLYMAPYNPPTSVYPLSGIISNVSAAQYSTHF
jgi:alpha-tubulin suppressor-like RCC1 family protein